MLRSPFIRTRPAAAAFFLMLSDAAWGANQSVFAPASDLAERVWWLTVIMTAGALAIQVLVIGLTLAAIYGNFQWRDRIASVPFVFAMGVIFPIVVLTALLIYGLVLMRSDPLTSDATAAVIETSRSWSGAV